MNINDFMGGLPSPPPHTPGAWSELMHVRGETFNAFCSKEVDKGILMYPANLATPRGQDSARLLFWRILEEFSEAIDASAEPHRLEELIDTINYCLGSLLLDPHILSPLWSHEIHGAAQRIWDIPSYIRNGRLPTTLTLATVAKKLADLTDKFRNRSWMSNSQDIYYAGLKEYELELLGVSAALLWYFPTWEVFWQYFMAKDEVLKFRLRSNY